MFLLLIFIHINSSLHSVSPLLLLFLFSFIIMMTFYKKSVHSFWGIASSVDNSSSTTMDKLLPCKCHAHDVSTTPLVLCAAGAGGGLGLITATSDGDIQRSHDVVESSNISNVKSTSSSTPPSSPPPPPPLTPSFSIGRNIGFFDDMGLMSCTESLGFESCDERRVDVDDDGLSPAGGGGVISSTRRAAAVVKQEKWRKTEEGMIMMGRSRSREVRQFPPPLSSLDSNGQPSFFLRPVRKDGRLELTEVRIDRPEILRAYREDGRLRLHLIRNDSFNTNEEREPEQEEHEEHEEHEEIHEENHEEQEQVPEPKDEDEEVEEEVGEEEEMKEEESREWRLTVTEEGFRRCHELLVSHHHDYHPHHHHHHYHQHHHHHSNHHLNLHVWSQRCVTTG